MWIMNEIYNIGKGKTMKHIERHHKGINIALRGIALMLAAVMCISLCPAPEVQAASASIKVTNVSSTHTLKIGEKKTLKVKTTGVSKKKQKKIKYKTSNKKIVTVSSKTDELNRFIGTITNKECVKIEIVGTNDTDD